MSTSFGTGISDLV